MKRFFISILFLFPIIHISAQINSGDPYSSFGIGILKSNTGPYTAMGGIGTAMCDKIHINFLNPPSYAHLDSNRFYCQVGVFGEIVSLKEQNKKWNYKNGNIDNFNMAFRIFDNLYTSMGINRISNASYHIYSVNSITGDDSYNYKKDMEGGGGLNDIHMGLAYRYKNISIGVNASWIFGKFDRSKSVFINSSNSYILEAHEKTNISGFTINTGILYSLFLSSKSQLTLGGRIRMKNNLWGEKNLTAVKKNYYSGIAVPIIEEKKADGDIAYPLNLSGGIVFRYDRRWTFGADYTLDMMSDYKEFDINRGFDDAHRINIGASIIPDDGGRKWIERNTYMAGAYYDKSYLSLNGKNIRILALTLGTEIPLSKRNSILLLNFGFDIGKTIKTPSELIEKKFAKFNVNIIFKERWFIKRKIN